MKNNKKLVNKTVEFSLLKHVSAGTSGGVYLPPNKESCVSVPGHFMSLTRPGK